MNLKGFKWRYMDFMPQRERGEDMSSTKGFLSSLFLLFFLGRAEVYIGKTKYVTFTAKDNMLGNTGW
jgi:hypothetical protein